MRTSSAALPGTRDSFRPRRKLLCLRVSFKFPASCCSRPRANCFAPTSRTDWKKHDHLAGSWPRRKTLLPVLIFRQIALAIPDSPAQVAGTILTTSERLSCSPIAPTRERCPSQTSTACVANFTASQSRRSASRSSQTVRRGWYFNALPIGRASAGFYGVPWPYDDAIQHDAPTRSQQD